MIFDKWIAAFTHEKLTCSACKKEFSVKELRKSHYICPECAKYMRIGGRERINQVVDKKSFEEFATGLSSVDFLEFPGYADKLTKAIDATGEDDAVICGHATVGGYPCAIFVMDSRFMMASMGSVVGEKITRTFEYATEHNIPVIGFTASGGARMQEGIISLMQMAKCSAAVKKHSTEGNLYITVLTDPTTGGVTASFAMQGDIILAEPNALVGFAGRRVVEQTTKSQLPDNFQSAEFILEHGFADAIVPREELNDTLATILKLHGKEQAAV
ncbi:MAG: acetyl-CoA carboxylase carboxyltransferase subunit beta [Lachnospiraceae bacterium]|nr:acetyl-CoA carboxylase carboxyltransferase subunit beta [Lachnospiraceae bacterium]